MNQLDLSKWTAVKHITGQMGPYTFHVIGGVTIPVSHPVPASQCNTNWFGSDIINYLENMGALNNDDFVIEQFPSFPEMFKWLSS